MFAKIMKIELCKELNSKIASVGNKALLEAPLMHSDTTRISPLCGIRHVRSNFIVIAIFTT